VANRIHRKILVMSGKGGVGKSSIAVNLAVWLSGQGRRVGLLDIDIHGPSIPKLLRLEGTRLTAIDEKIEPVLYNDSLKVMSIAFMLSNPNEAVIWRGPMMNKTIQQFFSEVEWGDLDVLVVDLPPGTGDAQLSVCQTVPLDGGVIVTTPQEASLGVVRKGIGMFQKVNVPILGIVENMSYFTTPGGERVEIFGHGGGQAEAKRQQVPFLGEVPLFTEIREGGDRGVPAVVAGADQPAGKVFVEIARTLRQQLA